MTQRTILLAVVLIAASWAIMSCAAVRSPHIDSGLQLRQVQRTIDLTTQLARRLTSITLANSGAQAASHFYLTLPDNQAQHVAFLGVFDESGKELTVGKPEGGEKEGVQYYRVDFGRELAPQDSIQLYVHETLSHVQQPFPAQISQTERQLVKYHDNHFFFSPYYVTNQKTMVKLASQSIESYSEQNPVSVKGDTITYGPYTDISPYRSSLMNIHFENNSPFLTITQMTKEIEVSHWGNVAVTENVDMQHDGAKLQGSFSRFDFQRNPRAGLSAIREIAEVLPIHARDIYYRDEIGNISTSSISVAPPNKLQLHLAPRFPLFGGWKTRYYMGYDLPIHFYVQNDASDSSHFLLNISFSAMYDVDVVIDDLTVRIILPEGAKDIQVHLPFAVDSESRDKHYTYLDTYGRPVVVIHKKNVVAEHNRNFQITYTFNRVSMLQEPLLLVIAFFAIFLGMMVYVRFELSITKEQSVTEEKDSRVADLLLKLRDIHSERSELHNTLLQASKKLGKSKNTAAYTQEKKGIEASLSKCHTDVLKLTNELEELDENLAAQVRQVERQEQSKQAYLDQLISLDISYRDKRLPKQAYEESRDQFEKFYNRVDEEIDRLIADLTEDLSS